MNSSYSGVSQVPPQATATGVRVNHGLRSLLQQTHAVARAHDGVLCAHIHRRLDV